MNRKHFGWKRISICFRASLQKKLFDFLEWEHRNPVTGTQWVVAGKVVGEARGNIYFDAFNGTGKAVDPCLATVGGGPPPPPPIFSNVVNV